jgi:mannose-6-phosphate isomerase
VLDEGEGYKVKRIYVLPHSRLSYQTHAHRSEHWLVVLGKATCVIDGQVSYAGPGDHVDVAIGQPHRIANDEDEALEIVEIQLGVYTGEDDIVRLEDDYAHLRPR